MNPLRVHLDHLIKRQSIRYLTPSTEDMSHPMDAPRYSSGQYDLGDKNLRYKDLSEDGWITQIRKPDFQRETNAWTPEDCVVFLDTAVFGKIIPSIILWASPDNGFTYVLDGAHRLSVLRAWMIDDWGDRAGEYYHRRDMERIREAARITRELVRSRIGLFSEFENANIEFTKLADENHAPRLKMSEKRYNQSQFYTIITRGLAVLTAQWVRGDYDAAEQSFLRINKRGQALDPWEATLIEYRHSSYARCIMSIATGGESGHYWPVPTKDTPPELIKELNAFGERASKIYNRLFVPTYRHPITDLSLPFMIAPEYFQKHKYLLEVLPLITEQAIAITEEKQIERLNKDNDKSAEDVIGNAAVLLKSIESGLDHMISESPTSRSLSLVPLFYWYSLNGKFIRALFYGFVFWLLSGDEEEIQARKIVLSINRDRFESILFEYKAELTPSLQLKAGAGLKGVSKFAEFFQALLELLNENTNKTAEELDHQIGDLIYSKGLLYGKQSGKKKGQRYSDQDKTTMNIREMFANSIRCHICGGVVDLKQNLEYYTLREYTARSVYQLVDPDTSGPIHPFCKEYAKIILQGKHGRTKYALPNLATNPTVVKEPTPTQLKFWGDDEFPG
jgi:hypothetical protein